MQNEIVLTCKLRTPYPPPPAPPYPPTPIALMVSPPPRARAPRPRGGERFYMQASRVSREVISIVGRPFKCPFCGASDSSAKGVRRTKEMGIRQIRRCKHCHRKFTPRHQKSALLRAAREHAGRLARARSAVLGEPSGTAGEDHEPHPDDAAETPIIM